MKRPVAVAVLVGAGLAAIMYASGAFNGVIQPGLFLLDGSNATEARFVPVNISIDGNTVMLENNCSAILFDVTDDQAFSIANGVQGIVGSRPLTHDIFLDVLDNFGIQVNQIKIDRYEDSIYKATMVFSSGNQTLDLDVRPSDAIALATRLNKTMYIDSAIMKEKSQGVC